MSAGTELRTEVRSHGRARADLVLYNGRDVTIVEAKLSDWKRAVAQATLNLYCADRSYIALWVSAVTDEVVAEARRHQLGVLSVSADTVSVAMKAPPSQPIPDLRRGLIARAFERDCK